MNFEKLISADDLADLIDDGGKGGKLVIVDCRFALTDPELGRRKYNSGHIPGAFYAHLDNDLAAPVDSTTGRHPLPDIRDFARLVARWGVNAETQVVVYDDAGGAIAARLWWMLKWIGHHRVALLDGGFQAWERAGYATDSGVPEQVSVDDDAVGNQQNVKGEMPWIDTHTLKTRLEAGEITLLDARAEARFSGDHEPIDPVAGHVPGAICLPFEANLGEDGCFLPEQELRGRFEKVLGDMQADATITHMCGSGVTACHNILAMEIAGLAPTTLYVGSWSEWITDPERSIATGV